MTLFVADIASYQAGLVPARLKPDIAALIIKCTEGTGYLNPDYANWLGEAAAAGLLVGAYHYVDGTDPAAQAAWLKANIVDPSVPVMIDEESVSLAQALAVADAMDAEGLHVRLMYLARSYWQTLGSPDLSAPFAARGLALVNASYPSSASGSPAQLYPGDGAAGWDAYGGVTPTLYQFTDSATESGQNIDVSAFRGDISALTALFTTDSASASIQEDDLRTTSVNGRAGIAWSAGQCHVIEANYSNAAQPDLVLNIELKLTTGPVYPGKVTISHVTGTATYEIPSSYVAACRGVILTVVSGPANVVYDVCAV
ncbi:MAG TPA: GH25 family lysozyme [Actinospica sp.]|nr:GH25 family lysozyme [Actinospica sp.]